MNLKDIASCLQHSVTITDELGEVVEVLYFDGIMFSLSCVDKGFTYRASNGTLFNTDDHIITPHPHSDTTGNVHYVATRVEGLGDQKCGAALGFFINATTFQFPKDEGGKCDKDMYSYTPCRPCYEGSTPCCPGTHCTQAYDVHEGPLLNWCRDDKHKSFHGTQQQVGYGCAWCLPSGSSTCEDACRKANNDDQTVTGSCVDLSSSDPKKCCACYKGKAKYSCATSVDSDDTSYNSYNKFCSSLKSFDECVTVGHRSIEKCAWKSKDCQKCLPSGSPTCDDACKKAAGPGWKTTGKCEFPGSLNSKKCCGCTKVKTQDCQSCLPYGSSTCKEACSKAAGADKTTTGKCGFPGSRNPKKCCVCSK